MGNRLTVAGLCAISYISCYDEIYVPIEAKNYPKVHDWFERMKRLPFYDTLETPYIKKYKQVLSDIISRNKTDKGE